MTPSPTTNAPASSSQKDARKTSILLRLLLSPWTWLAALLLLLLLLEPTPLEITVRGLPLDVWIEDQFFDPVTRTWIANEDNPLSWFAGYIGPKAVIIAPITIALFALFCFPKKFWQKRNLQDRWFAQRRPIFLYLLGLAIIPLLCGSAKNHTNVYCPYETTRYSDKPNAAPYVRLFDKYPPEFAAYQKTTGKKGHGFPGGHASGGFALFGLALIARKRRTQVLLIAFALAVGGWMSLYQMMRGAHYLSHNLFTLFLSALVITILAKFLPKSPNPPAPPPADLTSQV